MSRKRLSFCLRLALSLVGLVVLTFGLVSCANGVGDQPAFYLPPTAAAPPRLPPTATPAAAIAAGPVSPLLALPTPACRDGLMFLGDTTVPDGTVVSAGQVLDKRWLVENNGSCNWDAGYRFRLVEGSGMGTAAEQAVYPARSGVRTEIRMLLTAPSEPGPHRSAWQAYNALGEAFGDPFFVQIVVEP